MSALDVAGVTSRGCGVFVVGHVASPYDGAAAVIGFLHGHVRHEPVGRRPVPVVLTGLEVHAVAGADLLDRRALALAQADALGDVDRLAVGVGVPGGTRAGSEAHESGSRREGGARVAIVS